MRFGLAVVALVLLATAIEAQTNDEPAVRKAVMAFYAAFNSHAWDTAEQFATEDWDHINPFGGRTRGRAETLADLKRVHSTFLKGVTDTVESLDVRFATADVAVVTAISKMSTYTPPGGTPHVNERNMRTFVVVKRSGRWQIMQDQNTVIAP